MSGSRGEKPGLVLFCSQSRDLPRQGAKRPARTSKLNQENENKSSSTAADSLPADWVLSAVNQGNRESEQWLLTLQDGRSASKTRWLMQEIHTHIQKKPHQEAYPDRQVDGKTKKAAFVR